MKYAAYIVLFIILSSCKLFVHRIVYNSRLLPNYASDKKINKFYEKHAITKSKFISFSDSNFVKKIEEPGWAFEGWELYNIEGFQIRRSGDTLMCISTDGNFLKDFEIETMGYIYKSSNLLTDTLIFSKMYGSEENALNLKNMYDQFDYTLILYWSSWRGRYSSHILNLEKKFVLNNPELRIQVIKVNMDFRKDMKNTGINKILITADELQQKNAHNSK